MRGTAPSFSSFPTVGGDSCRARCVPRSNHRKRRGWDADEHDSDEVSAVDGLADAAVAAHQRRFHASSRCRSGQEATRVAIGRPDQQPLPREIGRVYVRSHRSQRPPRASADSDCRALGAAQIRTPPLQTADEEATGPAISEWSDSARTLGTDETGGTAPLQARSRSASVEPMKRMPGCSSET
jgi:hypothetical protein